MLFGWFVVKFIDSESTLGYLESVKDQRLYLKKKPRRQLGFREMLFVPMLFKSWDSVRVSERFGRANSQAFSLECDCPVARLFHTVCLSCGQVSHCGVCPGCCGFKGFSPLLAHRVAGCLVVFQSRPSKFGFILNFSTLVWGPLILRGNMHERFSFVPCSVPLDSARDMAELCRIRSPAFLWYPSPSPWQVYRLRGAHCPDAEAAAAGRVWWRYYSWRVCHIPVFPHCFFSYPNLTWTDGDSSGCGPWLLGSLHGKYLKSGQEAIPEPLRGTGCLWKTGLGRKLFQQRAVLSVAQTAVVDNWMTWIFPVTHFFSMRKHQTLCTENFLQKANLFLAV